MSALNAAKEFLRADNALGLLQRMKASNRDLEEKWTLDWIILVVARERDRVRVNLHRYKKGGA